MLGGRQRPVGTCVSLALLTVASAALSAPPDALSAAPAPAEAEVLSGAPVPGPSPVHALPALHRRACRKVDHRGTVFCDAAGARLKLDAADIPPNASALYVEQVSELTVTSNATAEQRLLHTVVLRDIATLTLREAALTSPDGLLRDVALTSIGSARLLAGSLTGRWSTSAHVRLSNVTKLVLDNQALDVTLAAVTLTNVSIARCRPGTFGPGIGQLTLKDSRLGAAEPLCVRLRRGVGVFEIHQSRIEALLAMSVTSITQAASSARLDSLLISDSSIGVWQSRAVTGRFNRMLVNRTSVRSLEPEAIHAEIPQVVFSEVALTKVHGKAFAGIQNTESLTMEVVSVRQALPGALTLNTSVSVKGVSLSRIYINTPCHCDMVTEAILLIAGNDTLSCCTAAETKLSQLIVDSAFCSVPGQSSVYSRFSQAACVKQTSTTAPVQRKPEQPRLEPRQQSVSDDQIIVFAVVLAGIVVALLVCVCCCVSRRKRLLAAAQYVTGRQPGSGPGSDSSSAAARRPRRPSYSTQSSQNSRIGLLSEKNPQTNSMKKQNVGKPSYCTQSSHTPLVSAEATLERGVHHPISNGVYVPPPGLTSVSGTLGHNRYIPRQSVVSDAPDETRTCLGQMSSPSEGPVRLLSGHGAHSHHVYHAQLPPAAASEVETTIERVRRAHPEHYC